MNNNIEAHIQKQVIEAFQSNTPLNITGNGSKQFYGNSIDGTPLAVNLHRGIINYEPTELVITARAGTPLSEIEAELGKHNQQLAFEPPHFSTRIPAKDKLPGATLGGTIACGLSGPARVNNGAARDFVLGCEIINGRGEQLKFGGQVMKNVAGYDVSRLICGSLGTLGVILNVSLKVLPKPESEISLCFELSREQANEKIFEWNGKPYPVTASCYFNGLLTLRLAGNALAVKTTRQELGGQELGESKVFWESIKEQTHDFFKTEQNLWRISTKQNFITNFKNNNDAECLTEWHGALHWLKTEQEAENLRHYAELHGGHATLFRSPSSNTRTGVFHPLATPLLQIHKNLKKAFDPKDILNRNKMYFFNR